MQGELNFLLAILHLLSKNYTDAAASAQHGTQHAANTFGTKLLARNVYKHTPYYCRRHANSKPFA